MHGGTHVVLRGDFHSFALSDPQSTALIVDLPRNLLRLLLSTYLLHQSFQVTTFVTRNSSIPLDELNLPQPLFLTPPIGNAGSSRIVMLLI